MKLQLEKIINARFVLDKIFNLSIPAKQASLLVDILRAAREIKPNIADYDAIQKSVAEECGAVIAINDEGTQSFWTFPGPGQGEKYGELIKPVLEKEIELNITPIPFASLAIAELSANQIELLEGWFLMVDAPPAKPAKKK